MRISLHPAGHVLGSAQVRLEHKGAVWVASGDYKLQADGMCAPFESVRCSTFITESTFGLPIYRWESSDALSTRINAWWQANAQGRPGKLIENWCDGQGVLRRHDKRIDLADTLAELLPQ